MRTALLWTFSIALVVGGCCTSSPPLIDAGDGGDTNAEPDAAQEPDAAAVCGNGATELPEACDDGNLMSGDGCSADCLSDETCGNGVLDLVALEQCDDGNTTGGDGCGGTCQLETCGNGIPDPLEACDDGNLVSGDGCSADCLSDERCGNGILDVAAAEICDDGNAVSGDGCSADCRVVEGCGDGTLSPPEECDDANTIAHDGCNAACRIEQAVIADLLELAGPMERCDVDGDGDTENTFGSAFGMFARSQLNMGLSDAIDQGNLILLFEFLGLDHPLGIFDPRLRLAQYGGVDGDTDPLNNTDPPGGWPFLIDSASLSPTDGSPLSALDARIDGAGALFGGPEDIVFDFPTGPGTSFPLLIRRAQITATVLNDGTRITGFQNGLLCGAVPAQALYQVPNPAGFGGATLLDLIVNGVTGGIVVPTQPDIDLDGDGLERFADANGDGDIDACTDGDGTVVTGTMCPGDARFADAYSTAFTVGAIWARIIGVF